MRRTLKVSKRTITMYKFAFLLVIALICTVSLTMKVTSTHAASPSATSPAVDMARTSDNKGYWIATQDGAVYSFGNAVYHGGANQFHLNGTIVGLAATSTNGGYWEVGSDGGVFTFGDADFYGSLGSQHLNAPIVGIARTPTNGGYWFVGADGGVFSFGDAQFYGSMGGQHLNAPISGIAATSTGRGYWLVGADGGVFAFGDAGFYGSMGGQHLNAPMVGLAATADNGGFWEVANDGGIFAFGTAQYYGNVHVTASPNQTHLQKVVAIAQAILNSQAEPGWIGGPVPYVWGGGHNNNPGPSIGTCVGYTGSITPCPANRTVGVDCSGFVRWVYDLAFGSDVLGSGGTNSEIPQLQRASISAAQPGDLVFYGTSPSNTHHVGIYIGNGKMINALKTGTNVEIDYVNIMSDLVGYFHYNG